ncbi:serpin-Z3-like [Cornus florida]|uniref:serpin-Z3-like n=1 Tax=Cornus florida TaxID=4283 RepID=UPI0028A198BE|nr:serpin-Z3-like [Cornus florida]
MDLCLKVANQVLLEEAKSSNGLKKNTACSPFSLNALLNMAVAGSTGTTLEQFLGFLGSESVEDLHSKTSTLMGLAGSSDGLLLSTVNGAWVDQSFPLKPSYQHLVQTLYKALAKTVDFQHNENKELQSIKDKLPMDGIKCLSKVNFEDEVVAGYWPIVIDSGGIRDFGNKSNVRAIDFSKHSS